MKQKDDNTIEEMEKYGSSMKVVCIFSSFQGSSICLQTQMILRISNDMQMRGNIMTCSVIQLIQFNGRNLMTSVPSLVKSQEMCNLVLLLTE